MSDVKEKDQVRPGRIGNHPDAEPRMRQTRPSIFPFPIGLTRAERRRIAAIASVLLRDPV